MRSLILSFILFALPNVANAVPLQMTQQGRLIDSSGASVSGLHDLTFRIYDDPTSGSLLWQETITVDFTNGYYAAILGADTQNNPLDSTVLSFYPIYMELELDSNGPMSPRQSLNSAPYAQMAGVSENLDGGSVNATEVSINGQPVISTSGEWVGTINVDWNTQITNMPADIADGDDNTQLSESDVESYITNAAINLAAASMMNGKILLTIADLLSETDIENYITNAAINLASGSQVGGKNIVASNPCADGDVLLFDLTNSSWICGQDTDTTLTATDVQAMIESVSGLALQAGATVGGNAIVTEASTINLNQLDTSGANDQQVLTYNAGNVEWADAASGGSCTETQVTHSDGSYYVTVECGTYNYLINNTGPTNHWFNSLSCIPEYIEYDGNGVYSLIRCNSSSHLLKGSTRSDLLATRTLQNSGKLSAGIHCMIDNNDLVKCWGANSDNIISGIIGDPFSVISAGVDFICGMKTSGEIGCWGRDQHGEVSDAPTGTFAQITTARNFSCAINTSGGIECWGEDHQNSVTGSPSGTFTDISSGDYHSCAINSSGNITCWGRDYNGECSGAPSGSFNQVELGNEVSCALRTTGEVECWGADTSGTISQTPTGTYSDLFVAEKQACVIDGSGNITCWGDDNGPLTTEVPAGSFSTLFIGHYHACALDSAGSLVCWGGGSSSIFDEQPLNGTFVGGQTRNESVCAIVDSGNVLCWGNDSGGQTSPP